MCALLAPDDLERVFGSPFGPGEAAYLEQTGGDHCGWINTDAPPVKQFSITVLRDGHLSEPFAAAGWTVAKLFDNMRTYSDEPRDVEGLGDDAFQTGTTLHVLSGPSYYSFSTFLGDSPQAIDGMHSLARQVLE